MVLGGVWGVRIIGKPQATYLVFLNKCPEAAGKGTLAFLNQWFRRFFVFQGIVGALNARCRDDSLLDPATTFPQEFNCDIDRDVRLWLRCFSTAKLQFADITEMGGATAKNEYTGEQITVPGASILIAGFVCKDLSRENNCRNVNALRDGVGSNGVTYQALLLENVVG